MTVVFGDRPPPGEIFVKLQRFEWQKLLKPDIKMIPCSSFAITSRARLIFTWRYIISLSWYPIVPPEYINFPTWDKSVPTSTSSEIIEVIAPVVVNLGSVEVAVGR